MADSTIGSLHAIQRGLEDALLGFQNILQKQGIDRHKIPFRPQIVTVTNGSITFPKWYPNDTKELSNLLTYGFQKFNPATTKPDIHTASNLAVLNNSMPRKEITIDVEIPFVRTGKRGQNRYVRLTGSSVVDIFVKQNPMIPITPVQDRIIPLAYNEYAGNRGRFDPHREDYHYSVNTVYPAAGNDDPPKHINEPVLFSCVPDLFRVDFFVMEDLKSLFYSKNQMYPAYGNAGAFGGLLVFPRFLFPTRFTTADADNTYMYPRYGIKGSGDKLHPNVMDFYQFLNNNDLQKLDSLTLTANIYLTRHDGQPANDNAHLYIAEALVPKGWRYPDTPNGKTVDPNIIYAMMPTGMDYGHTKFNLYTSYRRVGADGTTFQSSFDVGKVDDVAVNAVVPYPSMGAMKNSIFQLQTPTFADFTQHQTMSDTAGLVVMGQVARFALDQNYCRERVGSQDAISNILTISSLRSNIDSNGHYDSRYDWSAILVNWVVNSPSNPWPDYNFASASMSLNGVSEKIHQCTSYRGKHGWDSLYDIDSQSQSDNIPFAYFGLCKAGLLQWNSSDKLKVERETEYQIYPDWNNYYGRAITTTGSVRTAWGNKLTGKSYSIRQSSHRAAIDHAEHIDFNWNAGYQNPFFREFYAFDGIQPVREEVWYRNYVHAKTGREIFLAVACAGQRLFISDASTPNAPTWREVDIPLLSMESIRGICEYKGFYLFYTHFGYFFTTDFINFEYCDLVPGDKIVWDRQRRPSIEGFQNGTINTGAANWYGTNMFPLGQSGYLGNQDNYYCIDNVKIIEGYIYASIKSNCIWTADDATNKTTPKNRTFHYQILRSKYPIFKQLYEYVTPYDVYINHSYVDIYGRKKMGFKTNPEFLIGGARQHRLYTPQSAQLKDAQKWIKLTPRRKVYDNIIKCVEFKGELYALKFRFSLPNFYFERPYLDNSIMSGPIHDLMRSIPDDDHLQAEARLEKIYPGLASQDNAQYSEPIWIMNRSIARTELLASNLDITWNDYLVWGLYDLSNMSNVVMSRAISNGKDNQPYAYKKGFLASPANGSCAMEVIDGKLVLCFSCLTNKYGIYSTSYNKFSTTTGTTGWTPATNNDMLWTYKVMVIFDGSNVYQTKLDDLKGVDIQGRWGISYYLTKHPNWFTHRPTNDDYSIHGAPTGSPDNVLNENFFSILVGYRETVIDNWINAPGTSFNLCGTGSVADIKATAQKITGTTDTSTSTTLKYPTCPPPGFMMPTTPYRLGILGSAGSVDGMYGALPSRYKYVHFLSLYTELRSTNLAEYPNSPVDITGDALPVKYIPKELAIHELSANDTYIDLRFDTPTMKVPSGGSNPNPGHQPLFNGFRVLNNRILALFGFVVADITSYHPITKQYLSDSKPYTAGGRPVNLNAISRANILDVFKPAFAESAEAISDKRAMGQLFISPHDSIPVHMNGATIWPSSDSLGGNAADDIEMVDYTIDVQYIDGKYYQFLPGSIFVHEYAPTWDYFIGNGYETDLPTYQWIHKVLWTTPLVRSTDPAEETAVGGGTEAPMPTFNFWQINGRKPIYMNGYFFLPWCGLYVDLYGKTHSIPESSDFAPSEWVTRFLTNAGGGMTTERFALDQAGNHPGDEDPYYQIMDNIQTILPYTNYTDGTTPPISYEMYAYHTAFNYSGWNQFYKCGNRLYAYTPSAIGSQIRYIPSKSFNGLNVVNCIPYDVRPGTQEYLAMTEYTGHKPQFYHKKINLWDYQYQWETVNGPGQQVNRMMIQNKPYLMVDFPFHPTKVIVISRDRKLVISEYREFEFDPLSGYFISPSPRNEGNEKTVKLPLLTQRTNAIENAKIEAAKLNGDEFSCGFMAHAIRYEFQPDGGKIDLNALQGQQTEQIYPDENSWIDNNTVYIYNPRVADKGPNTRQPIFDANGKVLGEAGAFYDELPSSTPTNGIKADYGYRFNVIEVYAWC